jgi:uncharacterized repeat protein (TIGR01451 family)
MSDWRLRARRLGIATLCLATMLPPGPVRAHSVTVNGDTSDWTMAAPLQLNLGHIARNNLSQGEYVWRDATGDERTDFSFPDTRVDLQELRLTGDATNLYVLARMTGGPSFGNGAPQLQVAIDLDRVAGSGQPFFGGFADTSTSPAAQWERLIVTRMGSGNPVPVVYDPAFVPSSIGAFAGGPGVVELWMPWSALGLAGPPTTPLRFTVATFRSDTSDNTLDVGGPSVSNALDAVTNYGDPGAVPNTFAEVSDGVVDYFFDVSFEASGEVTSPVLISQFLYDPFGTETAEEWIEIQNLTSSPIDLSGYKLGDEETIGGGEGMRLFPPGSVLAANDKVVVALSAAGFQTLYGYLPDYEVTSTHPAVPDMAPYATWASGTIALANGGDEVLLLDASDTVVDVASYATGTWPGVTPHATVAAGHSLKRGLGADTDDCGVDFLDNLAPDPGFGVADLSVSKDDGAPATVPGTTVVYTIVVANAGPGAVTGATVTDTLPASLTGASWLCSASPGSSCSPFIGLGSINDTVDLLAGGTATYTLSATVDPGATGTLSNTATVAAPFGVSDPNLSNNASIDTDTLAPQADLTIAKSDGLGSVVPGTPVTYTITVANPGPSHAPSALVIDMLPPILLGATWTCSASFGSSCTPFGIGNINDFASVLVGGTLTYTLTATVDPVASFGDLVNTADVTPLGGVSDPNPFNNSSTDVDPLTPIADLAVTTNDFLTDVVPGQPLVYTVTLTNAGPSGAAGVLVNDNLPPWVVGLNWTCLASFGSACNPVGSGNISDVALVLPGGTLTYTLTGTVDAAPTLGPLPNVASVQPPIGTFDPNTTNNFALDMDTVVLPSLAVNDVAVAEGNAGTSIAGFTVTLSPAPFIPVTVNYTTQDVTAEAGSDYVYASGMLTFGIGETSKPIPVTVNGDTQYEPSETLEVILTSPSSATIGDGTGILTIANDDTPAGPSRVFASVLGLDTNDCSNIATPCRTLNAAIAQVAVDGEVIVVKSGSYAGATITKGVKIDAASGVVAFSGLPITVNSGPGTTVVIRGLTLKAVTPGTGSGLLVQSAGALFVENTVIDGWDVGIRQQGAAEAFVKDSVVRNNNTGLQATLGKTTLDNARLTNNGIGIDVDGAEASVRGSTVSGNGTAGIYADGGSLVTVEKSQIGNNGTGVSVAPASGATVLLSRSVVTGNNIGLENAGGTLLVYGNNAVRGNATNTSGTITTVGLQ